MPTDVKERPAREADWLLQNGRLLVNGRPVFLKIAKPLRNYANPDHCRQLIGDLDRLAAKGFTAFALTCYWHHFDLRGDGSIGVSLEPLVELIEAIHAKGLIPCVAVEIYGVGGGQIPQGFWERYPEAIAVDANGKPVRDDEYGFMSAVPSIFHPPYLDLSRRFIRNLASGLPCRKLLYFETTVEPQFMGHHDILYGAAAQPAYTHWLEAQSLAGPAWPEGFPVAEAFRRHPVVCRFRAESLAAWVNADAAAWREVAGPDAYVAVDYLETAGDEMWKRNGDSALFLTALTCPNILQVNWHWHIFDHAPNQPAYERVRSVLQATGRSWAVSEHMTLNGLDFQAAEVNAVLSNALAQGTGFGFEFVNVMNASADSFSLYHDDWTPKPLMAQVDDQWPRWQATIAARLQA